MGGKMKGPKMAKLRQIKARHLDEQPTKEASLVRVFNSKCKPTVCQKGNRTVFNYHPLSPVQLEEQICRVYLFIAE